MSKYKSEDFVTVVVLNDGEAFIERRTFKFSFERVAYV